MKLILFILSFLVIAVPAFAEEDEGDLTIQDSITYTLDDGVMSKEEMEKEAQYIYRLCEHNVYQKSYYNCKCVSGEFLIQREKEGPTGIQTDILDKVMLGGAGKCANTEQIAGDSYATCMNHVNKFRELSPDNEDYCTCVANRMAREFSNHPRLDMGYIEGVRLYAMNYCDNPKNRPKKTAVKTAR